MAFPIFPVRQASTNSSFVKRGIRACTYRRDVAPENRAKGPVRALFTLALADLSALSLSLVGTHPPPSRLRSILAHQRQQ
ncbi:uncharacterized protein ARMOST_15373 [Armillaria ostoyae]|uniref:Uncharacterized protein n=1 Tax=Armillaria ostoyae TaxID=47428 RepID=A0A284RT82_ARMOS|nr:uncharacterized protein ARMOST_15373 [Armillaria ostoyae]